MAQSRVFNSQSVVRIMQKRTTVPATMEGKKVRLTVRGNGQRFEPKNSKGEYVTSITDPGVVFAVIIYNTESNSGVALSNPRNKELAAKGMAAERAGNTEEAHKLFSEFLNNVQLSFSVPESSTVNAKLADRVDISAKIIKITTENGSLLTIDPASISILAPEELAPTSFSFDAIEDEKKEQSDAPVVDELIGGEPVVEETPAEEVKTPEELAGVLTA